MPSNLMGDMQGAIEALTGIHNTFDGDLQALCDSAGIVAGQTDGRILALAQTNDPTYGTASAALNYFLQGGAVTTQLAAAPFYAPLTSSLVLARGTGLPTFTRASTATQTDFEGNTHQALAGEARFQGARRVRNFLSFTEAFQNAVWINNNCIVTDNYAIAPDGTQTASRVLFSNTDNIGQNVTMPYSGFTHDTSVWMKSNTGLTQLIALSDNVVGGPTVPVTASWTRFSWSNVVAGASSGLLISGVIGNDLLVWHPQIENVTGQSNQNPAEYVSVGVLSAPYHGAGVDGVQYFPYLNGNTVVSNVVTSGTGAAIASATLKGYLSEGSATNYFLNSGAPATQTTGSLGVGTYCCWVLGAGSIAIAGGTATITGGGSATAATPLVFNVTVAGTVVCTYTTTLTFVQLENNPFPTNEIDTAGATVTRNADLDSEPTSGNIIAAQGTIYGEFTPNHAPLAATSLYLWGMYVDANNSTSVLHDGTNLIFRKRIAGTNYDATIVLNYVSGTTYKYAATWGAAGTTLVLNATVGTPNANTTAAQIAATMQEGAAGNGAGQPTAQLKNRRIWQTQLPNTTLQAITTP